LYAPSEKSIKGDLTMSKIEKIETKDAPGAVGPYSQAIQTDSLIFVSGQLPLDAKTGQLVKGNIQEQTDCVLENIRSILKAAGSDLSQVVRCDVFLKDMNDFKSMNEVYSSKFSTDPKPARQAIQVGRLPLDAMIEISCIAQKA
jgi:2-iminobutanoate/2-iminopropanoate deaminase